MNVPLRNEERDKQHRKQIHLHVWAQFAAAAITAGYMLEGGNSPEIRADGAGALADAMLDEYIIRENEE